MTEKWGGDESRGVCVCVCVFSSSAESLFSICSWVPVVEVMDKHLRRQSDIALQRKVIGSNASRCIRMSRKMGSGTCPGFVTQPHIDHIMKRGGRKRRWGGCWGRLTEMKSFKQLADRCESHTHGAGVQWYFGVMDLLPNEDWHLTDTPCVHRQNVTQISESAVTSGANLARTTPTVSTLIFYMKRNTKFELCWPFLVFYPACQRVTERPLTLPWRFEPREQGDRRRMLEQKKGEAQPWQPVIVSQRLMVSCCLCVSVGSRPTTDAEQIMEALFLDIHSVTHIHMWVWTRKESQVSRKILGSSFISGTCSVVSCSDEEVRLASCAMKQESISSEEKSVCKWMYECVNSGRRFSYCTHKVAAERVMHEMGHLQFSSDSHFSECGGSL